MVTKKMYAVVLVSLIGAQVFAMEDVHGEHKDNKAGAMLGSVTDFFRSENGNAVLYASAAAAGIMGKNYVSASMEAPLKKFANIHAKDLMDAGILAFILKAISSFSGKKSETGKVLGNIALYQMLARVITTTELYNSIVRNIPVLKNYLGCCENCKGICNDCKLKKEVQLMVMMGIVKKLGGFASGFFPCCGSKKPLA